MHRELQTWTEKWKDKRKIDRHTCTDADRQTERQTKEGKTDNRHADSQTKRKNILREGIKTEKRQVQVDRHAEGQKDRPKEGRQID